MGIRTQQPILLLLVIALAAPTSPSAGVRAEPEAGSGEVQAWFASGLGISSLGSMGLNLNFSVQFDNVAFTIRTTRSCSKFGFFEDEDYDVFNDISFLFGRVFQRRKSHLALTAGVARVTGTHYKALDGVFFTTHEKIRYETVVGFPFECQIFRSFNRYFGLGLYSYFIVSKHKNFGGICVSIFIGRFTIK